MITRKNWVVFSLLVIAAILLAPFISEIINIIIIEPAAYYWWGVKQAIAAIPQVFFWYLLISGLGIIIAFFLLKIIISHKDSSEAQDTFIGPVQSFSETITWAEKSHFFRWLIANRMAKITLNILLKVPIADGKNNFRYSSKELSQLDWNPPENIRKYIEAGLDTSQMNPPQKRIVSFKIMRNPDLEVNLQEVVEFVETLTENNRD